MSVTGLHNSSSINKSARVQTQVAGFAPDVPPRPASKGFVTLLSVYVFLVVSHVLDLSNIWKLRIPLILLIILSVATFARGGIRYALSSKITKVFGLFTVWVVICFPFSYWRSASVEPMREAVESFVIYLIIMQTVTTTDAWRKIAGGYAYAAVAAAIYGFFFSRYVEGRLSLAGGTFGDPNVFALLLLEGVPFLWLKAKRASLIPKIFFWACTGPLFLMFAKAGSRAGLLALATMLLVAFFIAKGGQRILLCFAAIIGLGAGALFLPGYLKVRYLTIFSPAAANVDTHTHERLESDVASSEERKALLQQSIAMTFEHPIFGVGPGCFAWVAWKERHEESGFQGIAFVTHNTYTQVSSETGIPGAILFLITILLCVRTTFVDWRKVRNAGSDVADFARYLLISFTALMVGIFFLSMAYTIFIAVFVALAASLHKLSAEEAKRVPSSKTLTQSTTSQLAGPVGRRLPVLNKGTALRPRFRPDWRRNRTGISGRKTP